jgi:hypothetical protein
LTGNHGEDMAIWIAGKALSGNAVAGRCVSRGSTSGQHAREKRTAALAAGEERGGWRGPHDATVLHTPKADPLYRVRLALKSSRKGIGAHLALNEATLLAGASFWPFLREVPIPHPCLLRSVAALFPGQLLFSQISLGRSVPPKLLVSIPLLITLLTTKGQTRKTQKPVSAIPLRYKPSNLSTYHARHGHKDHSRSSSSSSPLSSRLGPTSNCV